MKAKTDNVRIVSIVGRYLEHARIYIFGKGDRQKVYISSADNMTRNTTRRVEVAAPVLNESIRKRITDYFNTQLSDNIKAREQQPDGTYKRVSSEGVPVDSQKMFFAEAYENAPKAVTAAFDKKEKKGFWAKIKGFFKRNNK